MPKTLNLVPWAVSGACLIGSFLAPEFANLIWIAGVLVLVPFLIYEFRQPVNYKSLKFSSEGFQFSSNSNIINDVCWSEVIEVYHCRSFNPFANQIDTEWDFKLRNGTTVTVLVEWPQCSPFARAIVKYLPDVSGEKVACAIRKKEEGRWECMKEEARTATPRSID